MDPESNTYVITKVKAEDMGTYTCTATNLAGSITTNTSLTVLERPRFVKVMTNKTVRLGETAVLECQATGAPRPSLTWSKDGGHLVGTERHFFTADVKNAIRNWKEYLNKWKARTRIQRKQRC